MCPQHLKITQTYQRPGSGSVIAGADGPIVVLRERMRKEKRNGFYVMGAKTIPKRGPGLLLHIHGRVHSEKLLRLDPQLWHILCPRWIQVLHSRSEWHNTVEVM